MEPSKGDIIGSIIVNFGQHRPETQEYILQYKSFIPHDKSYIDKIIKNLLKHVPYSMDDFVRV